MGHVKARISDCRANCQQLSIKSRPRNSSKLDEQNRADIRLLANGVEMANVTDIILRLRNLDI